MVFPYLTKIPLLDTESFGHDRVSYIAAVEERSAPFRLNLLLKHKLKSSSKLMLPEMAELPVAVGMNSVLRHAYAQVIESRVDIGMKLILQHDYVMSYIYTVRLLCFWLV